MYQKNQIQSLFFNLRRTLILLKETNFFFYIILLIFFNLSNCTSNKQVDNERFEPNAYERAREFADKNPVTIFGGGSNKSTNFAFGTSNILWRASLKTLDFIPLSNVDYSGGVIITDWYSVLENKEQIKIQIRFFSNELRSDALDIKSHKRTCESNGLCKNLIVSENFNREVKESILNTARLIKIEESKKK